MSASTSALTADQAQVIHTLIHEAGHAAVMVALRMRLLDVSVGQEHEPGWGTRLGYCTSALPRAMREGPDEIGADSASAGRAETRAFRASLGYFPRKFVSALAGVAAEQRAFPWTPLVSGHALTDFAVAYDLAAACGPLGHEPASRAITICAGMDLASALVEETWSGVRAIARALMEKQHPPRHTLTGRTVRALVRSAGVPVRPSTAADLPYRLARRVIDVCEHGHPHLDEIRETLPAFADVAARAAAREAARIAGAPTPPLRGDTVLD